MSSIRKNSVFMLLYELFIYLIPFITAPYIARVLGTTGTGIYSYTNSISSYFVVFIQLGVTLYGRREIASQKDAESRTRTFRSIFIVLTVSFAFSSTLYFGYVFFFSGKYYLASLIQFLMLVSAFLDISWFFFGIEKFTIVVIRNILVKIVSLVLIFTLVKSIEDTNLYIAIMAGSTLVSVIVMWFSLRKYMVKVRICKSDVVTHIKPLLLMTLPILSIQLFSLTDKVFLGIMVDIDAVGIYENMYKISKVPNAAITTLGTVLLPRITNMLANGEEEKTKTYIEKSLSLTMIIAVSCCFGLMAIAPHFVPVYLGNDFASGVLTLQILCIILIPLGWGNVFRTQYILPRKKDNIYIISVIAAAIINIILNLFMIPLWGIVGAAIASLISELSICVYQTIVIRKDFFFIKLFASNLKYIIAGFLMFCLVWVFSQFIGSPTVYSVLLEVIVGIVSFIVLAILFEAMSDKQILIGELLEIKNRMMKKNRNN